MLEGVRSILNQTGTSCAWATGSPELLPALMARDPVNILLLDKGFGFGACLQLIQQMRVTHPALAVLVLGNSMSEHEALTLLKEGARGMLHRSATATELLQAINSLRDRGRYLERCVFQERRSVEIASADLTVREGQVLELVQRGLRNREIAAELGISVGTVKIHLKHVFEKTGVKGRESLVLSLLRTEQVSAMTA